MTVVYANRQRGRAGTPKWRTPGASVPGSSLIASLYFENQRSSTTHKQLVVDDLFTVTEGQHLIASQSTQTGDQWRRHYRPRVNVIEVGASAEPSINVFDLHGKGSTALAHEGVLEALGSKLPVRRLSVAADLLPHGSQMSLEASSTPASFLATGLRASGSLLLGSLISSWITSGIQPFGKENESTRIVATDIGTFLAYGWLPGVELVSTGQLLGLSPYTLLQRTDDEDEDESSASGTQPTTDKGSPIGFTEQFLEPLVFRWVEAEYAAAKAPPLFSDDPYADS